MKSLKETFKIKSYETDLNGLLKISALMLTMQEMANIHADLLGFGYDHLQEKKILWVLSRSHIIFHHIPQWRDEITVETWHKGSDKLFGLRDFCVSDDNGRTIMAATTSWLIINTQTRRVQRIEQHLDNNHPSVNLQDAIKEPAPRVQSPEGLRFIKSKEVEYSDIDMNNHTNNAKYMEWALDSIYPMVPEGSYISEFIINFNHESKLGERLDHYCSKSKKGAFFEAKSGESSVVQIEFIFSN